MTYYLAIDIGASSGRHILGHLQDGKLKAEEIYRFKNGIKKIDGSLTWDIEELFHHVKMGIKECKALGKIPTTVAIDTWGLDYVLLDKNDKELLPCFCYRDPRTERGMEEIPKTVPSEELYSRTGIQRQSINTIYQLWSDKHSGKLERAARFLMMPEYLSYRLTGVMKNEYTNATTTNLVNLSQRTWDVELLKRLGFPAEIFAPLSLPGERVGEFTKEVEEEIGFNATVIFCPSHDTASAVAACPLSEDSVYVSSGTWSLIGTESLAPFVSKDAMEANFTNEGGVEYRYRFLKNIMGMWLFQSVRKDIDNALTYDQMMEMAMSRDFKELIDPTDPRFLAPESMIEAVREYLNMPDLPLADVLSCLYHSLAGSYKKAVEEIEKVTGKTVSEIHIVGGGSKDAYLNRLTAEYTKKKIIIGLKEATATGNLLSQIMADKGISLTEARETVKSTFDFSELTSKK